MTKKTTRKQTQRKPARPRRQPMKARKAEEPNVRQRAFRLDDELIGAIDQFGDALAKQHGMVRYDRVDVVRYLLRWALDRHRSEAVGDVRDAQEGTDAG